MELDYEALASDLVRALRGRRSQVALSRRLGYGSNAVYTWESGRRWPTASVFLQLVGRVGHDVPGAVRAFHRGEPAWLGELDPASPDGVSAWLRDLKGHAPLQDVAARAGRSRFAVARWLSGKAEPRLPDFLRLVQATSLRLLDLVALWVDPGRLRATARAWRRLEAARTLAWSSPWAQAVLLGLELRPYQDLARHDEAWLAARLGLEPAVVRDALSALVETGQVRWTGTRYAPVEVQAVELRRPASGTSLKEHWASVGLERLREGGSGAFSYNVFTVSEADLQRIEDLQRAHYRAIRALVADSGPSERLVLVNLQLVPLDRAG